ncbi:MAG: TolC family protein [Bdellovibrionaceae bacterium]|nr:TolC family protein [Pseudobdellovibrionaceae bacterium]
MRLLLILMLISLAGLVQAAERSSEIEKFDLKKAIAFAVENSPTFDSMKRQLKISQLDEESAEAKLLPSLDLTATHGILDSSPRKTTSPWNSEFNLGITESLYDNGVTRINSQIAKLNRKQAELNFEDQKNKVSLDIVSQYLIYSLNIKLLEIQEKQFKLISRQYERISRDYHQGIKTKKDFLRFKTQVSRGEINLVTAQGTVEKSKQELQRLMSLPQKLNAEVDFVPISLEAVKNEVPDTTLEIENHLQSRAAQIQKEANQLSRDLISRKTLPEWYLSTGLDYTSSNYAGTGQSFFDNARTGWSALVTVKYNFFDWGTRARDKEVAFHKSVVQNNDLDSNLLLLQSSMKQVLINVKQVQRNFGLAKELLALERDNIDYIEREYRNGKVQYLDLISGLNSVSDAEIQFYSAVSDLQTTRYTLLYHQGKLYEELLK